MQEKDKRETGRQAKIEQQRGAVSPLLAQVGSGPGIFSIPEGVLL